MKNGKCSDEAGVAAEMLKCSGQPFRDLVLSMFNDVLSAKAEPPASWRRMRLVVLLKKGDPLLPKN